MKRFDARIQTGRYYLNNQNKVTTYIHMAVFDGDTKMGYMNIHLPEEDYDYWKDVFRPENGVAEPVKEVVAAYLKKIWIEGNTSKEERLNFQKLINDNINELEQERLNDAIAREEKRIEELKEKVDRYRKTLDYLIKEPLEKDQLPFPEG